MDDGEQFTKNKKFFTAVPVVLCLLATHFTNYDRLLMYANLAALIPLLIAKVCAFAGIRPKRVHRGRGNLSFHRSLFRRSLQCTKCAYLGSTARSPGGISEFALRGWRCLLLHVRRPCKWGSQSEIGRTE